MRAEPALCRNHNSTDAIENPLQRCHDLHDRLHPNQASEGYHGPSRTRFAFGGHISINAVTELQQIANQRKLLESRSAAAM